MLGDIRMVQEVKFSLSQPREQSGGLKVVLHSFLTRELNRSGQFHAPASLNPGK